MEDRERTIRLWFDMWLQKRDLGIGEIFAEDAVYIESWGPEYRGARAIRHWFEEWNTRGRVLRWDILQYFHKGNQTVVEWRFHCAIEGGPAQEEAEKFAEALRFSDPVSSESLRELESELLCCVNEIQQAITDSDCAGAIALLKRANALLLERNCLCKLNKSERS